jgi:hypothetical protein
MSAFWTTQFFFWLLVARVCKVRVVETAFPWVDSAHKKDAW